MQTLRHIVGLTFALLFVALSATATPLTPERAAQTAYSPQKNLCPVGHYQAHNTAGVPASAVLNLVVAGGVVLEHRNKVARHRVDVSWDGLRFGGEFHAPNRGPSVTIRDHYEHHNAMRTDVIDQLRGQGYRVSSGEASFGSACGTGRCRPDIIYEAPDGTKGIIEIKTGNADLSIRQTEIFPQIENENAISRGQVAGRFGLRPGIPLKDQGYPNGIPIQVREFPGVGE